MFVMATAKALRLASNNNHISGSNNLKNSVKLNFGGGFGCSSVVAFLDFERETFLWLSLRPQLAVEKNPLDFANTAIDNTVPNDSS